MPKKPKPRPKKPYKDEDGCFPDNYNYNSAEFEKIWVEAMSKESNE